jgi:UDP-glucose 4-epimerase
VDSRLRVLITGGAGFIGSHLTDALVDAGHDVKIIDDLSVGRLANVNKKVKTHHISFVKGDLRDCGILRNSVQDIDAVVHLAAMTSIPLSFADPELTFATNVGITSNLLDASLKANVSRFVFASSCAVYGEPSYLPIDEHHPTSPISPYAVSKLAAEQVCQDCLKENGLDVVVLRLFNVYGPRQSRMVYSGVVSQFVYRARRGLPLIIHGDGTQTRDFVHVSDVVSLVLRALVNDKTKGEVFNVGSGQQTSVNNLAKIVLSASDSNSHVAYERQRVGDLRDSFADISKAGMLLDYKPMVSLEKGLQRLVSRAHGDL